MLLHGRERYCFALAAGGGDAEVFEVAGEGLGVDASLGGAVGGDAGEGAAEEGDDAVRVASEPVGVASAELGEAFEELFFVRALGVAPAGFPGFVRPEVVALVKEADGIGVTFVQRHFVEVGEVEAVGLVPREGAASFIARALGLGRGWQRLVRSVVGHTSIVASDGSD